MSQPSFPPPRPQPTASGPAAPPGFTPGPGAYPGAYAPYPDAVGSAPEPVVPRTVTSAFALMLTRAVLSLIATIVTLLNRNQLLARVERQQELREQRTGVATPIDPKTIVDVGIVVGVVVGLVFLVFYVFLAFKVRRGRQWARVVTWVFAGLGVLGLFTQFLVSAPVVSRVLGTVSGLLDIAVIILLALAPTSRYIAGTAARRHG